MTDHQKRKRSKAFYASFSKRRKSRSPRVRDLEQGMVGFLVTCNDKEKQCTCEIINILIYYADEMYGPERLEGVEEEGRNDEDVIRSLEKELEELKQIKQTRRFRAVRSPSKNVVFIQCRKEISPTDLTHRILTSTETVRYCQRLLPVSLVCHASIDDIKRKAPSILDPHFRQPQSKPVSYAVAYKARNNSELNREATIDVIATLISGDGSLGHKVSLKSPELVVIVEVVKKHCLMSVVRDYHYLRKYNVHSIVVDKIKAETDESARREQEGNSEATLEDS
jgi:tRNA acetyltransferase TAN1